MTAVLFDAERDNLVRYRPDAALRRGHVESYFLKANAPEGGRAFWLKFTIFAPAGRPASEAVAEVWAILFDRATGRHVAGKDTFPIADATLGRDRFQFVVPGSVLEPGRTAGRVRATSDGAAAIEWDLDFTAGAPPLHILPSEALYETEPFPRTKQLSPHPDSRFRGRIAVGGETWEVSGWPGAQGHNWGAGHGIRYAWAHVNAFRGAPGTYFEGASTKIPLGPITSPWLTVMYLHHEGRGYDFRGLRHLVNRSVEIGSFYWSFVAESDEARLEGRLEARTPDLVGLIYRDPDGAKAYCLNSKIARARLVLSEPAGRRGFEPVATLETEDSAALELLFREPDHGIPIRA